MLSIFSYYFWDLSQLAVKCRRSEKLNFYLLVWKFSQARVIEGQFISREPKLVQIIGSFEKSRIREIGGEIIELEWSKSKGINVWFEISGGSENRGFEKSGFHCIARHLNALTDCTTISQGMRLMITDFFAISAENQCFVCLGIKDSKELRHRKSSTSTLLKVERLSVKVILTKQVIRIAENAFVICQ